MDHQRHRGQPGDKRDLAAQSRKYRCDSGNRGSRGLPVCYNELVLRSEDLADVVKAEPTLLAHKREYLRNAMARTRISAEKKTALRAAGITANSDANWVVL